MISSHKTKVSLAALVVGTLVAFAPVLGSPAKEHGWGGTTGQGTDREIVRVFGGNVLVDRGDTLKNVVVIGGNAEVRGHVKQDLVVVFGGLILGGSVERDVAVVGGSAVIESSAFVGGELVTVGSQTRIDPAATVVGDKITVTPWLGYGFTALKDYARECLFKGRFFALSLPWTLIGLAGIAVLALLMILLFPGPFNRCMEVVETKTAAALLTGILVPLAFGPVVVALTSIVIGIPVIPVLMLVLVWAGLLGGAAICAYVGRQLIRGVGAASSAPVLFAAVLGMALFAAASLLPFAGGLVVVFVATFGMGAGVFTLFELVRSASQSGPRPTPRPQPVTTGTPETSGETARAESPAQEQTPASREAPGPAPAAGETVAGFWVRSGAALIDILLVMLLYGITFGPLFDHLGVLQAHDADGPIKLFMLLAYLGTMWGWKQTTIGGIVFKLKLRRTDNSPVTPGVAVVRALGLLLAIVPLGLGFLWIAWDKDRQGWHDKIAGTTVRRVPDTVGLV